MELFIKRKIPPTWKFLSNRKKNNIYNEVGLCSIKFRFRLSFAFASHVFVYFFKVQTSVSYNFPQNVGTFTAKTPNHFKIPFTLHIAVLQFWLSTCFNSVAMMILHFTFLHSCIFFKVSAYPWISDFDYCHNFLSHGTQYWVKLCFKML